MKGSSSGLKPPWMQPTGKWSAKVFSMWGLVALLVSAVVIYSASLVWKQIEQPDYVHRDLAPAPMSEAPIVGDPDMPIAERSVLGTTSTLSTESLRLFLMAVQPGRTPFEGTAQLGTDPRNPQTMVAGARFPNGARLAEIHADHVILERDGQRIVLKVDHAAAFEAGGPQVVKATMAMTNAVALKRELTSERAARPERKPARPEPVSSLRDINEVVRAQPTFRDSQLLGFAVIAGSQRGKFSGLGLEAGDVVTTIDGQPVQSASQWSDLSAALLAGQLVGVTVERQGSLIALTLDGGQMTSDGEQMHVPPPEIMGTPMP